MSLQEIAKQYLTYLENNDIEKVIGLFSEQGLVNSPIYGIKTASEFYTDLSTDTKNSKLQLKGIFEEPNTNKIAIYFNYHWTLANNDIVSFDVVDIISFNSKKKIEHLHIIYDTVKSRALINKLNNKS